MHNAMSSGLASRQTLVQARAAGREAAERGADSTEQFDAEFRAKALEFIVTHITQQGRVSGESTTLAAVLAGIRPRDDRHFGSVYQKALRENLIHIVGLVPRLRGHASSGGKLYAPGPAPAACIPN
jgi:hypothetical protein